MSGIGLDCCCSRPGALVVIAAIPLCQVQSAILESSFDPCFDDMPEIGDDLMIDSLDPAGFDMPFDAAGYCGFPLRGACFMDCVDAVDLVQEVGHVAF